MTTMKAVVFQGKDRIRVEDVPKRSAEVGDAVVRITATPLCGTDVHIVKGEYSVTPGLIIGHASVAVFE